MTTQEGWYTREQFVARYAELTGRDVSSIDFHEVLGVFKLAVILQQIYFRFRRGQTMDRRFEAFGERVRTLLAVAARLSR
jgi:aminoglycoside phosphotransferase (APT) family kinase protein